MFINIFGFGFKSLPSTLEDDIVYPRKRSVGSKGVRFNTSRVVFYTHSKLDYDRGGKFFDDSSNCSHYNRVHSGRAPVLDSDDEDDSLALDITDSYRKTRRPRRSSSFFF
jgi:hypothetical protein